MDEKYFFINEYLAHRHTVTELCKQFGISRTLGYKYIKRFNQMGYSGRSFNLRMTRQEIGSYLGLTLETVSRTLSALNELGMISVEQREINLLDPVALKTLRRLPPAKARIKVAEKVSALVNKNLLPQWNGELAAALN